MSDKLKDKAKKTISGMDDILEQSDIDNIKTDGITIRCGNKVLKLEIAEEQESSIEDEVREEFREKLRNNLQQIKQRLNTKISEMVDFTNQIREEAERKERELKNQLARAIPMPEVYFNHAENGLSVVRGRSKNCLVWLVQGIYRPLFVDDKRIEPRYAKKMITPIIIMIKTEGKYVKEVSTHKPLGLSLFQHYHQSNPDCWGDWNWNRTWSKPEDVINIAKQAEAVLEKINTGSIAMNDPNGLPRLESLKRHIVKTNSKAKKEKMNTNMSRIGADSRPTVDLGDVWET
jgi:hypothetical protein